MPLYFLLGTLTETGQRMLHNNADLMIESIRDCKADDAQILGQYAVLGGYDYVMMVEADDNRQRWTFTEIVENLERELIVDALKRTGGHQRKAASELGLTERILGYKIKKYEVLPKRSV